MKLPNSKNTQIPKEKITKYILSEIHPVGRSKAKFFRELGFDEENIELLIKVFKNIAQKEDVVEVRKSIYGINYSINGTVKTPNGKIVKITTIWFIEIGNKTPRFVTAYPV